MESALYQPWFFVNLLGSTASIAAEVPGIWREGVPSHRIAKLQKQLDDGDSGAAARFWEDMNAAGTPLVEPVPQDSSHVLLTFLYRSKAATSVGLTAQLTVIREPSIALRRLRHTDIWYKTYWIRSDIRFSYGLSPNPSDDRADSGQDR